MTIAKKIASATIVVLLSGTIAGAGNHPMGFFVTSVGMGDGANLGGLQGADAYCTNLAEKAGTMGRTWRAYLSTQVVGGRSISARDRVGLGPWYNANGELIASDLDMLHLNPNITKRTAVDENGNQINGRGDRPNEHDMLTGSRPDGTAFFAGETNDRTCSNWTSSGEGSAQVGHSDRQGGGYTSWNAAHPSRGCSQAGLVSTGGSGLFYCFAADE